MTRGGDTMRGMRWWGAAFAAVLLVSGCSGEDEQPASSSDARGYPTSVFTKVMRDASPQLADESEESLQEIADAVCDVLKPGDSASWVEAVKAITDTGMPADEAGGVIALSTKYACPEKAGALPS